MTTENKRDLAADLALCDAVPAVHYDEGGGYTADAGLTETAMRFFEQAPEGWPHAIRRALDAEAEVERLKHDKRLLHEVYDAQYARATEYSREAKAESLRAAEWEGEALGYAEENERLLEQLMRIFQKARNDCARWDGGQCVGLPVFQDRVFTQRLVRELEPILFPEVEAYE